jgi:hypothetical protein
VHVGIDGSNLRAGGGVTHIVQLLAAAEPSRQGIDRVTVWVPRATGADWRIARGCEKPFQPALDGSLAQRLAWRSRHLPRLARECDVCSCQVEDSRPRTAVCDDVAQHAAVRTPRAPGTAWSWMACASACCTACTVGLPRRADGVMFLNEHAREVVIRHTGPLPGLTATIPHGVDTAFVVGRGLQRPIGCYDADRPFRLLYVSIVDLYKHQERVAEAVATLRARRTLPVALDLAGPAYLPRCDGSVTLAEAWIPRDLAALYGQRSRTPTCLTYAAADAIRVCLDVREHAERAPRGDGVRPADRLFVGAPMPQVLGTGRVLRSAQRSSMADALVRLVATPACVPELAEHASHRASRSRGGCALTRRSPSWRRVVRTRRQARPVIPAASSRSVCGVRRVAAVASSRNVRRGARP